MNLDRIYGSLKRFDVDKKRSFIVTLEPDEWVVICRPASFIALSWKFLLILKLKSEPLYVVLCSFLFKCKMICHLEARVFTDILKVLVSHWYLLVWYVEKLLNLLNLEQRYYQFHNCDMFATHDHMDISWNMFTRCVLPPCHRFILFFKLPCVVKVIWALF